MDAHNAFFHVFPGAIYLNQGKEYSVTTLDITNHKAYCVQNKFPSKYYTLSRDRTDIIITNRLFTSNEYNNWVHFGKVQIRTNVFAFNKISKLSSEILEEKPLSLPSLTTQTVALWIDIPELVVNKMNADKIDIISAIHAVEHCMIGLIPLFIKANANEFDTECPSPFDTKKRIPRIIIAEKVAHGLGYCQDIIFRKTYIIKELIDKALDTLVHCPCADDDDDEIDGCLSCCHSSRCHEYNIVSSRKNAIVLLKLLKPCLFSK